MLKILTTSLISLLVVSFVSGCSTGSNDSLKVSTEFDKSVWHVPKIRQSHPKYKTIIINHPIAEVRKAIMHTAELEGFDEFRDLGTALVVRRIGVYGDIPVHKEFRNISTGGQAGLILAGVLMAGATIGNFDHAEGSKNYSQPEQVKAVVGIAEFKSINKNTTELKINFNRVFYKWDTEMDKNSSFFNYVKSSFAFWNYDDSDYKLQEVQEVVDPHIYEFAFNRLQGLNIE